MAAWLPLGSGFTGYATRFADPALGFALGWNYFFKYIIVTPNNLTAASLILQFWIKRDKVNPGVFITVFLIAIVAINYFGIKFFGEFEFVRIPAALIITTTDPYTVAIQYQSRRHPRLDPSQSRSCVRRWTKWCLRLQILEEAWSFQPICSE